MPRILPSGWTCRQRTVADAKNGETLPGDTVRTEGQAATGDPAADEAYDGLGDTYALFKQAFNRDSLDGNGLPSGSR